MKKYLYVLAMLLATFRMLHAQPPSIVLNALSSLFYSNTERSLMQSDIRSLKPEKMNLDQKDHLRSGAVEKMDSLVVPDREKAIFTYDEHGHLTQFTYFYKSSAMDDWTPSFQQDYHFSPEGYLLEETYSVWSDVLNDWNNQFRDLYTYLPNGNPIEQISYTWDEVAMVWESSERFICSYISDNMIDQKDYYNWDSNSQTWNNYGRAVYNYDAMDRLKEIVFSIYNSMDAVWVPELRVAYFYNSDDLVEVFQTSSWEGTWQPRGQTTYSYNSFGELIQETDSWYDIATMSWIPSSQDEYEYDANGNMISNTFLPWDLLSSTFVPEDRRVFEYDVNTLASDLYFPHIWDGDFIFNSKMIRIRIFDYEGGTWPEKFYGDFYYSPVVTSIMPVTVDDIRVFPNPAHNFVVVEMPTGIQHGELMLLNVSGQRVFQQKLQSEHTIIPVQYLPSGNYVLAIRYAHEEMTLRSLIIH